MKSVVIDVSKIVYAQWDKYNETLQPREMALSQKQWVRKFKINDIIIEKVKSKINTITDLSECYSDNTTIEYDCNSNERQLTIFFKWIENCNINDWYRWIENDIRQVNSIIWQNGLTCYVR